MARPSHTEEGPPHPVRALGAESSPPTLSPALPSRPDPLFFSHQGPEKQGDSPSHEPESVGLELGFLTLCPVSVQYTCPGTNGPDLSTSIILSIALRRPVPALLSSPGCVTLEEQFPSLGLSLPNCKTKMLRQLPEIKTKAHYQQCSPLWEAKVPIRHCH